MLTNHLMDDQLRKLDLLYLRNLNLPLELNEIIEQGFFEQGNCNLSFRLLDYCKSVSLSNFEDEIAYECFVNSFHMEDYVNDHFLEYSVFFTNKLIRKWGEGLSEKLNVIIALDDESLLPKIKFHVKRYGNEWLAENDLDSYAQPILITTEEICT